MRSARRERRGRPVLRRLKQMTTFREMRRADRALGEDEAREILARAEHGVLATMGADGWPYAVPVNHVLVGDTLYIHCATEGHKLDNILIPYSGLLGRPGRAGGGTGCRQGRPRCQSGKAYRSVRPKQPVWRMERSGSQMCLLTGITSTSRNCHLAPMSSLSSRRANTASWPGRMSKTAWHGTGHSARCPTWL